MKKSILISAAILAYSILITANCFSQGTAINNNGAAADSSAMLDVSSNNKGILVPRMLEAEKNSIISPATGLLIYQTDAIAGFWYFNGVSWVQAIGPAGATGVTGASGSDGTNGANGATGATGATGVTGATGLTGNTGSGGSGGSDLLYPDGTTTITAIIRNNTCASAYTVPAGKNLYITAFYCPNSNVNLNADGKVVYKSYCYYGSFDGAAPFNPIIVGEGKNVTTSNGCDGSEIINGFLVDALVTPVIRNNLNSSPYTVPSGKTFVILNYYSMGQNSYISIGGYPIYRGYANFNNNTSGSAWDNIRLPIFVPENSQVTSNENDVTVTGYLK